MTKRKNSSPVKTNQALSSWTLSMRGNSSSDYDASPEKRVRFNSDDVCDNFENQDILLKSKSKKLLKSHPRNCVILGSISFSIIRPDLIGYELAEVDLGILFTETEGFVKISLKISLSSNKNISNTYELQTTNDLLTLALSDLMQHHYIWVLDEEENVTKGTLNVNITTTTEKTPILKATKVVELFFGKIGECDTKEQLSIQQGCNEVFFKEVQNYQKIDLMFSNKNVQHRKLIPKLRPYQVRAVQWMLFRENEKLQNQNTNWLSSVVVAYKSKCSKNIYFNKYSGVLSLEMCEFPSLPRGGILADEMGLGKTVAIISLILNNNRNINKETDNSNFILPGEKVDQNVIVFESSSAFDYDEDVIAKNKEGHLNADEKLKCDKASNGPALKKALTEWYESKLSEYSASSTGKRSRRGDARIKCICGNVSLKQEDVCVRCPSCEKFQHSKCVGYKENFQYFCPSCWTKQKLVKSSGTLIVAPNSIYHQWFDEIKKHVAPDSFQNGVYMYDGLKDGFIQPSVLALHDIVITTYSSLRAEVNHAVPNESNRKLRSEERFLRMCSPLSQIQWWRLCLDEAQMVENGLSHMNLMANLVTSVNRWSVTGTPIQKSISDLYYLVDWLGVQPYTEKVLWDNLLYQPYNSGNKSPLHSVMSKIFWRNSKEDVAEELGIPNQTVTYHFLKFTAIEQNFYMREHAMSSADFSEGLRRLNIDDNRTIDFLDKTTLNRLLAPLLNLRQACSHPLAVKGNKISSKTGSMTLTELLKYLCNKTKVECEEGMRKYVAALNGLAGIYCIKGEWPTAVEHYRQVLQFTEEYKDKVHIDSLQRIHTLTNLAEVLQYHPEGISPTLRDDSLKIDAKTLEDKYKQRVISDLTSDETLLNELSAKVSELEGKFETGTDVWWNRLLHFLTLNGSIREFMDRIAMELSSSEVKNDKSVECFLSKISSVKGLEMMWRQWLGGIEDNREKTLKHLKTLKNSNCEELTYHAVDCHLRPLGIETKKEKCQLCTCESILLDYECSLFDVSRKIIKKKYEKVLDGAQTKGSWRAQNAEKCLKVLLNVSKSKSSCEPWCLKDGRTHIQLLEAMKKEFKQLRAVWMSISHRVQASDEIFMCKLRLRLRLPGEPIPPKLTNLSLTENNKENTIFIIEHHEVEPQRLKLIGELELSKSEFKKKYGTLLYLGNLGQKENPKPDPCPVCKSVLENEWCVLQCGHSYCIDCIRIMLLRSPKSSFNCPVCREITKSCDLSFIDLSGKQENSDITVMGDHSTKVDGIVRSLLELKRHDPKVKVLIFSTWAVVLKILEVALSQNGISFRRMPGHKYQLHIREFRDPNLNITVLLLPISWGSKGLNLTEASHVFLVEPIMNPSEELQAIGRVHRIGQSKETVVHRFLINGTIEEKIHAAVSEAKDKWGQKKVTVEDLKNLFDMKNEFVTSGARDK